MKLTRHRALTRHMAKAAAIAACAAGVAGAAAVPAAAGVTPRPTARAGTAAVPRGLLPMATSWTTARNGIVLGYPSRTTGAKPYLLETGNAGKTWQSLTAPPVKYPADNDQPDAVWSAGVIAVTDGTHIVVTSDSGKHWLTERLSGLAGEFFVDRVVITHGRVYALVITPKSATVYSGPAQGPGSGLLRAVRGLSISGSAAYGDISADGGTLQVDLANNYTTEKYWYSTNGTTFTAAPLPCPATLQAWLGGVRSGKVIALCSDGPSAIGLGETDAQLRIAAKLGGAFSASGPAVDLPNIQGFAAASAQVTTVATEGWLLVTADAGQKWTAELPQANGASWNDLAFPSATTGFVVCSTVNNSLREIATVYRTTNSAKSWSGLSLP